MNQGPDNTDTEVVHMEESFNHLISKVGALVNHSFAVVSRMRTKLDKVFQKVFLDDLDTVPEETTDDPYSPSRDSGFLQGVGLEEVLDSFFDFGKSVLDEFGAVVTQVFDDISQTVQEEKKRGKGEGAAILKTVKVNKPLRMSIFIHCMLLVSFQYLDVKTSKSNH